MSIHVCPYCECKRSGTNKKVKRIQVATIESASSRFKKWTHEEDKVVKNYDISTEEIAKILGRTIYAVRSRRHNLKNG